MKTLLRITFAAMLLTSLFSCEKATMEEEGAVNKPIKLGSEIKISFDANNISNPSYDGDDEASRNGNTALKNYCSRISLAIFDETDNKLKAANQELSDNNFGHFDISLNKGTYGFVFIAHNGDGNPTFTSPSQIKFPGNKVTDTFYYYGQMDIEDDATYDVTLKRAVGKFRLVVKDETPKTIKQMKIYYTGGSSTFDATTGYGCVNSKQTEYRTVSKEAYEQESRYEVYTFPHQGDKKLKFEISALRGINPDSPADYVRTIGNVTMKPNTITQYSGYFYGEAPEGGRGFNVSIDGEWKQENYEY
ncbi:FimB/Mfa2 family fimbrial subunit [Prevotella sp.]|uniref:FimB/Mfa2 family fimbrial subunit n=1 Tax=Prevotella sp. TaxID=59823 RepID=UPI004026F0B3